MENLRARLQTATAIALLITANALVLWATAPVWTHQNLNDDSYITLTYAKNLASGGGFVFNHAPATLGTTTPLFTLAVALLAAMVPALDVAEAAIALSLFAWIGTGWLLFGLLRHQGWPPLAAASVGAAPLLLVQGWAGFVGMETWLFQFLLVASLSAAARGRVFLAGVCVGALCLVRGEGALLGPVLALWLGHRDRRQLLAFAAGGALLVVPWCVYALWEFGTLVPNTLAAKRAQAAMPFGGLFFVRVLKSLIPRYLAGFSLGDFAVLNAYVVLIVVGSLHALRTRRVLALLPIWGAAYLLGYSVLNPKPYYWYVLNLVFVAQVMAGVGLGSLILLAWSAPSLATRRRATAAALLLAAGTLYPALAHHLPALRAHPGDTRGASYRELASWINRNAPDASVAFIEIGYLGYFTPNRVVDLAGLVDPVVTRNMREGGYAWAFWHYQPDLYVHAAEFDAVLGDITPGLAPYRIVHEVDRGPERPPIRLYARSSAPDRTGAQTAVYSP